MVAQQAYYVTCMLCNQTGSPFTLEHARLTLTGSGRLLHASRMWLRPRARRESPVKQGSNVTWTQEEGSFAMPVHTRVHQVMTTALLDSDIKGSDEIGRWDLAHNIVVCQEECACLHSMLNWHA